MILVTGAAGKTGQKLIRALSSKEVFVRALVRQTQAGEFVQSYGAKEFFVGDMADLDSMKKASQGVQSIYHISPNVSPNESLYGDNVIRAAKQVGVQHFVFHSVLHPQTQAMPHHWQKLQVEEFLLESGLAFTILQPAAYMQNIQAYRNDILNERRYPVPYSEKTRTNLVDLNDIAEVGAKILTETGHENAIYELAGSESLSPIDITNVLSSHLGFPIEPQQTPREEWEQSARNNGLSGYQIETLSAMFDYYEQYGFLGNPKILSFLLGRNPTSFASYVSQSFIAQRA
jgi:uncharacterized protein YbjT (DUF2867 family)